MCMQLVWRIPSLEIHGTSKTGFWSTCGWATIPPWSCHSVTWVSSGSSARCFSEATSPFSLLANLHSGKGTTIEYYIKKNRVVHSLEIICSKELLKISQNVLILILCLTTPKKLKKQIHATPRNKTNVALKRIMILSPRSFQQSSIVLHTKTLEISVIC